MTDKTNSYADLLQRVWQDENFKNRFLTEPKAILAEMGANVPDSVRVEVHENSPNLRNYVLLKKEQLEGANLQGEEPLVRQVLQQALDDDAFKAKLLANPKAAIKEATAQDLPESVTIKIYEDTPTVKHLVIPVNPASEELSDLELEMVAGGISKPSTPGIPNPGTIGIIASDKWFNQPQF